MTFTLPQLLFSCAACFAIGVIVTFVGIVIALRVPK